MSMQPPNPPGPPPTPEQPSHDLTWAVTRSRRSWVPNRRTPGLSSSSSLPTTLCLSGESPTAPEAQELQQAVNAFLVGSWRGGTVEPSA